MMTHGSVVAVLDPLRAKLNCSLGTGLGWKSREPTVGPRILPHVRSPALAGLKDLPSQSCRRYRVDRPVCRPHDFVSAVVCPSGLAAFASRALWLGVTAHPSAEWIARQLTEACGWSEPPRYIIRDRDGAYGEAFIRRLTAMGIRDRPISARSDRSGGTASITS